MSANRKDLNTAPQISFISWMLGGPLVSPSSTTRNRKPSRAIAIPRKESSSSVRSLPHIFDFSILVPFLATNSYAIIDHRSWANAPEVKEKEVKEKDKAEEKAEEEKKAEEDKAEEDKKKEAENKEEEEKSKKGDLNAEPKKDGDTKSTNDQIDWTPVQDAIITGLKAAGKSSWVEIATATGPEITKHQAKERWKELVAKNDGVSKPSIAVVQPTGQEQNQPKVNTEKTYEMGKNNDKDKEEEAELKNHRLKPDAIWNQEDCNLLTMLEARYTDEKWLVIQAGFYNLTGRMVRGEMIEAKFSKG